MTWHAAHSAYIILNGTSSWLENQENVRRSSRWYWRETRWGKNQFSSFLSRVCDIPPTSAHEIQVTFGTREGGVAQWWNIRLAKPSLAAETICVGWFRKQFCHAFTRNRLATNYGRLFNSALLLEPKLSNHGPQKVPACASYTTVRYVDIIDIAHDISNTFKQLLQGTRSHILIYRIWAYKNLIKSRKRY